MPKHSTLTVEHEGYKFNRFCLPTLNPHLGMPQAVLDRPMIQRINSKCVCV